MVRLVPILGEQHVLADQIRAVEIAKLIASKGLGYRV